jgi:hypothetical protein
MEAAKALCQECPARAACLAGALRRQEPWGVWGGEVFLDGAIVPRKRPRGRPPKTDAAARELGVRGDAMKGLAAPEPLRRCGVASVHHCPQARPSLQSRAGQGIESS